MEIHDGKGGEECEYQQPAQHIADLMACENVIGGTILYSFRSQTVLTCKMDEK